MGIETGLNINSIGYNYEWNTNYKLEGIYAFKSGIKFQRDLRIPLRFSFGLTYRQDKYHETTTVYEQTNHTSSIVSGDVTVYKWNVPIELRGILFRSKMITLSPGIGLNLNRQFKNKHFLPNYSQKDFDIDFGGYLGLEYKISENFKVLLDPQIHLLSFTYNKNLYFGCNAGLFYTLSNYQLTEDKKEKREKKEQQKSTDIPLNRNSLFTSIGYGIIWLDASLNYERILSEKNNSFHTAWLGKAKIGHYITWGDSGNYGGISAGYLLGKRNNFIELTAGAIRTDDQDLWPSASLGYRRQRENFQIRTGFGFPEMLYFSIGGSF